MSLFWWGKKIETREIPPFIVAFDAAYFKRFVIKTKLKAWGWLARIQGFAIRSGESLIGWFLWLENAQDVEI